MKKKYYEYISRNKGNTSVYGYVYQKKAINHIKWEQ